MQAFTYRPIDVRVTFLLLLSLLLLLLFVLLSSLLLLSCRSCALLGLIGPHC